MAREKEKKLVASFAEKLRMLYKDAREHPIEIKEEAGVKKWSIHAKTFLITLKFDWRYPFVVFDVATYRSQSLYLFKELYAHFLNHLEEVVFDGFVKSNYWTFAKALHQNKRILMDHVGGRSKVVYNKLERITEILPYSTVSYNEQGVFLQHEYIHNYSWEIKWSFTEDTLWINNVSYKNDLYQEPFKHLRAQLEQIRAIHYKLVTEFASSYRNIYYEAEKNTLSIFEKNVSFRLHILLKGKETKPMFQAVFADDWKESESLDTLACWLREKINAYIVSDRIRAIKEKRL